MAYSLLVSADALPNPSFDQQLAGMISRSRRLCNTFQRWCAGHQALAYMLLVAVQVGEQGPACSPDILFNAVLDVFPSFMELGVDELVL
jgi:hypothetical protein